MQQSKAPYFFNFYCSKAHTHIIDHYNPSVKIIELVSHITYVVCVYFIHKWWDLQFKVDSEQHISWKTFHCNFIYSQGFYQKSAEKKSSKKYFLYFVLMSGLGLEHWRLPRLTANSLIFKISWMLMSSVKMIYCWRLIATIRELFRVMVE